LVEDLPTLLPMVLAMPPAAPPFFAHYSYDAQDTLRIQFAPIPKMKRNGTQIDADKR